MWCDVMLKHIKFSESTNEGRDKMNQQNELLNQKHNHIVCSICRWTDIKKGYNLTNDSDLTHKINHSSDWDIKIRQKNKNKTHK